MSAFAVAAFHDTRMPASLTRVDAVVWVRATGVPDPGVDVSLRVWTPAGAEVVGLTEVAPGTADLLPSATPIDERTLELELGRWSDGVHEIDLAVEVPRRSPGDEMLVARVTVTGEGDLRGEALVATAWTDDPPEPSRSAESTPADRTTGTSPEPRHIQGAAGAASGPCPECGEPADDGDRFCEACGCDLSVG